MKWPSDEDQERDGVLRAVVDIAKKFERQRDCYRKAIEEAREQLKEWPDLWHDQTDAWFNARDILAEALKEEDDESVDQRRRK